MRFIKFDYGVDAIKIELTFLEALELSRDNNITLYTYYNCLECNNINIIPFNLLDVLEEHVCSTCEKAISITQLKVLEKN